ncbi:MAG: hypothetical protein U0M06_12620 [Clostridia bacterium]|nr:hypothetical protein [Clostridia bacterium]
MSNVIEEFYYGNLEPQELTTELTPKLKKKLSEIVIKEEELTSKLSESEKELFSNYTRTYIQFSSMSNSDSFITGFRLGARFIYDTFIAGTKG